MRLVHPQQAQGGSQQGAGGGSSAQRAEFKLAICSFVFYVELALLTTFSVQMGITLDYTTWGPYYYAGTDLFTFSNPFILLACSGVVRGHARRLLGMGGKQQQVAPADTVQKKNADRRAARAQHRA